LLRLRDRSSPVTDQSFAKTITIHKAPVKGKRGALEETATDVLTSRANGSSEAARRLLDRDEELLRIDGAIASAALGRGSFVVVEGRPGLGKSCLLEATVEIAAAAEVAVLGARGSDLEADFPFDLALQLFEPRLRGASAEDLALLFAGSASLARPLFGAPGPAPDRTGDGSLLHGLYWLAANLAERSPTVVVIDDVQWADRQSLEFLLYLLQRIEELPIVVVLALRRQRAPRLGELTAKLLDHPSSQVLSLAPLSEPAVAEFLARTLSEVAPEFGAACATATGGNPLLLRELCSALRAEGVEPGADAVGKIPELDYGTVNRWIRQRLARVGTDATRLSAAVAALGAGAMPSDAAALAGLDPAAAAAAADRLADADLLAAGERLEFVHPIVRWAVYATLSGAERARIHRAAAERFQAAGATVDRVATQLRSTPTVGEPWALEVLRRAADEARSRGAPEAAAAYLRRALEEPMDKRARAGVLVALGTAEATVGEARAQERLTHALELVDAPESRARIFHDLGRTLGARGDLVDAGRAFRRGLDALGDDAPRSPLAAQLEGELLTIGLFDPVNRETVAPAVRVVLERPPARPLPENPSLLAALALARSFAGESESEVRELVARATERGLLVGEPLDPAVFAAAQALGAADEIEQEHRVLNAAIEDARRRGSVMAFATASYLRSWPNYFAGRLADAVADVQHAFDSTRYGWEMYLPAASAFLSHTLIERGEFEKAAAVIEKIDAGRWAGTSHWAYVLDARGRLLLLQDEPARALEDLLECGRLLLDEVLAPNPAIIPWRSRAALAAARLGDRDQARELALEEVRLARRFGARRPIGMALRALGQVEEGETAVEIIRESTAILADSPSRLEHLRSLVYLGGALRRVGDVHEARECLLEGLATAEEMAAGGLAGRARKELLGVGVVARHDTPTGLRTLTPSQQRVVQMAARGMTNREIAEALFVTIKAVEWHLTRSYSELGIRSRRELGDVLGPAAEEPVEG
jgi:DNA-binding CsgD family transcriptional regulator